MACENSSPGPDFKAKMNDSAPGISVMNCSAVDDCVVSRIGYRRKSVVLA